MRRYVDDPQGQETSSLDEGPLEQVRMAVFRQFIVVYFLTIVPSPASAISGAKTPEK